MKRTLLAAFLATGLAASSAAQERQAEVLPPVKTLPPAGAYISASLGYVVPEDMGLSAGGTIGRDNGYRFSGAVGYDFRIARIEGEFGWQQTDALNKDITVITGMLNAYYDFRTGTAFTPFLGAGFGIANVDFNTLDIPPLGRVDQSESTWAWQTMGGISYALDYRSEIHAMYRYSDIGDVDMRSASGASFTVDEAPTHSFEIGTRVRF